MKFPRSAARTSEKELLKNFDVWPSRTEPTVIDGEITGKRAVRAYADFTVTSSVTTALALYAYASEGSPSTNCG